MLDVASAGLSVRHPKVADHGRVQSVMDTWWGGLGGKMGSQRRALLLPRLFFQHFADTSHLVEYRDGRLAAFLIGFLSQSEPSVAYIHFVGVDPALRRAGLGTWLYSRFFTEASERGARIVRCITSPGNSNSIAFHTDLGFHVDPSDLMVEGVSVQRDYDGPGLDRISFSRPLGQQPDPDGGLVSV